MNITTPISLFMFVILNEANRNETRLTGRAGIFKSGIKDSSLCYE